MPDDRSLDEWTLDGALEQLERINDAMPDRQFVFILGSGASFESGIPTGKALAEEWLEEMHRLYCIDDTQLEAWVNGPGPGIEGLTFEHAAENYPKIFERRFRHDRDEGYAALERAMEGKTPSLGYSLLAEIIQNTRHKLVITTNFDNLVADALAMHAHQSPLVVAHESLAGFIRTRLRRPLIAKIHRDLFLDPLNDEAGVATLGSAWTEALRKLFQFCTPVVVGYGGNDGSLMGLLEKLPAGTISGRMLWCYRGNTPNHAVMRLLEQHHGVLVPISGFDDFMLRLAAKLIKDFKVAVIADRLEELGKKRAQRYREQIEELQKKSRKGSVEQQKTGDVLRQSAEAETSWWAWELRASAEPDIARRNEIYREGIRLNPSSAPLMGSYASFLTNKRKDDDAAETMYKKALELEPRLPINTGKYANLLADRRRDYAAAEAMYKKALEFDPNHAINTCNYANFLADQRKDYDAAEVMYKKALELDPNDATILGNYANFLYGERKDYDAAEVMYKKALELDADDANNLANFIAFLLSKDGATQLAQIERLLAHVDLLSSEKPSQALAEALLYGCLYSEITAAIPGHALGRLKRLLEIGFLRSEWDFAQVFAAVLPRVAEERRELYRALGDAILDETKLAALDVFPLWRVTVATDSVES